MSDSNKMQNDDVRPVSDYAVGWKLLSKGQRPQPEDSDEVMEGYMDARSHYE